MCGLLTNAPPFQTTRRLMREMGELSSVPIEPPEQTRLLDACCSLPDVIGAGVPGGASLPLPLSPNRD